MENRETNFEFDPAYSEFNPLIEEIQKELKGLITPENKEHKGIYTNLIKKLIPSF